MNCERRHYLLNFCVGPQGGVGQEELATLCTIVRWSNECIGYPVTHWLIPDCVLSTRILAVSTTRRASSTYCLLHPCPCLEGEKSGCLIQRLLQNKTGPETRACRRWSNDSWLLPLHPSNLIALEGLSVWIYHFIQSYFQDIILVYWISNSLCTESVLLSIRLPAQVRRLLLVHEVD